MQELKGKTVLLLAPKFFGYELEIKKELEIYGSKVFLYDERPKNDFFTKVCIRLNLKSFISKNIDKYYKNIIEETKNIKIDYLFLVNPETIDQKVIEYIKKLNPNIKVYTYMWDSIKNKRKSLDLLPISDKFFTFDSSDKEIDSSIKFLPLFYIRDYENVSKKKEYKYDISFIGSVHSDRYSIVKQISKSKFNMFMYFFSPSKILFLIQNILYNEFRKIEKDDISFVSLDKKEIIDIIENSKSVIDIEHPMQNGLTMRTMEMLGAKKKLITTNKNIRDYDFYNDNNIYIIDRNNPIIDKDFINSEYQELDINIYEKYSLRNWIKNIFEGER
jgi:hypothetical protein